MYLRPGRSAHFALVVCAAGLLAALPAAAGAKTKSKAKAPPVAEITVESPAQGAIARPGSSVTVRVHLDPALNPSRVSLLIGTWNELISFVDDAPPYVFAVPIDPRWSGPVRLNLSATSARGALLAAGDLLVNVVPSDLPVSIAVTDPVRMAARRKSDAPREQINVRGTYADGIERDIGRGELGTSFHSSDAQVVAVDGEGFLTAKAPGSATVTVRNGELSAQVPVTVEPMRTASLRKTANAAAPQ